MWASEQLKNHDNPDATRGSYWAKSFFLNQGGHQEVRGWAKELNVS